MATGTIISRAGLLCKYCATLMGLETRGHSYENAPDCRCRECGSVGNASIHTLPDEEVDF